MQLPIGSRWTDSQGREFRIDAVDIHGAETWVAYTRVSDNTSYCCFAEAFTHRFSRTEHDSRA
jgi:hypothetical protein